MQVMQVRHSRHSEDQFRQVRQVMQVRQSRHSEDQWSTSTLNKARHSEEVRHSEGQTLNKARHLVGQAKQVQM
jgi:hypothetical protein